ncbi:Smr/MutS family protein [Pseudahrensia aquimaris]|uniref:Smr/MutS family protein n=1 Tax=Pseudahrensia aquimaris TaxID=744461 RepID=A0ABW3FGG6_9HYPH
MKRKMLSGEDKHLWRRVARSTTPMSERKRDLESELAALLEDSTSQHSPPPAFRKVHPPQPPHTRPSPAPATPSSHKPLTPAQPIDPPVLKKLAKGRLDVDARLDLHGMTSDRARFALVDFLELSRAAGHRIVLVITGKGMDGRGVLRQSLPHWLELPPCTHLVNGFRVAHPTHGGDGAFYVRLRRPREKGGRGLR